MGFFDRVKSVINKNPEIKKNVQNIGKSLNDIGSSVGNIVDNVSQTYGGQVEDFGKKVEKNVSDIFHTVETKIDEINPNVYKFVNSPEVIEALRKDLGIKLRDNHAELIEKALPGVKLVEEEKEMGYSKVSCSERKIGVRTFDIKGPTFIPGFNVKNDTLEKLVSRYQCADTSYRTQKNENGTQVSDGLKVVDDMVKFCQGNLPFRNINFQDGQNFEPCFIASDLTTKKVNQVIDEELDKFLVALDNNSESGAKLHLQNARAVMVMHDIATKEWNEKLTDRVIENVVKDSLGKRLQPEIVVTHEFKDENMKEFMNNEVTAIRNENNRLRKILLNKTLKTARSSFKDYVKTKDATLFKVATGFALNTQSSVINEINNNTKRIGDICKKYVALDLQDETMVSVANMYKNKGRKSAEKKAGKEREEMEMT